LNENQPTNQPLGSNLDEHQRAKYNRTTVAVVVVVVVVVAVVVVVVVAVAVVVVGGLMEYGVLMSMEGSTTAELFHL
jgi:t-SNARE complex subunit (syntaxin)